MDIKKIQAQLDLAKESKLAKMSQTKLSVSIRNKEMALDASWREAQRQGAQNAWDRNPERKKTMSKKMSKLRKENPVTFSKEQKDEKSRKMKELHNNPEFRKKYIDGIEKRKSRPRTQKEKDSVILSAEKRQKALVTPHTKIESLTAGAEYYGISIPSLQSRMDAKPHLYYYEDVGPGEPTYEKVCNTPYGIFRTKREAFLKYEGEKTKSQQAWWRKMKKLYPEQYYETKEPKREWDLE